MLFFRLCPMFHILCILFGDFIVDTRILTFTSVHCSIFTSVYLVEAELFALTNMVYDFVHHGFSCRCLLADFLNVFPSFDALRG